MALPTSPTIRRQRLGHELRLLRRNEGLTLEQVCEQLDWASTSKLSRIELGQSRPDLADVMDVLDVYTISPAEREKLIIIARDAAATRGWWRALGDMGRRQRAYAELEASAATIFEYHQSLVPGLLQTPEYARVRVRSGQDVYGDLNVDVDARARTARPALLRREQPPRYEAVLDEAVLRRAVAPPDVRQGQLRHLLALARLPSVSLQVLPFDARLHDWFTPHTTFSIYTFPDPADPRTVVLETLTSDIHLTDDEDVVLYARIGRWLQEAALSPAESTDLLAKLADGSENIGEEAAHGRAGSGAPGMAQEQP
nr:helix-turn-helix transcriptional regulator [Micromonospora sp. DSM 115978]